MEQDLGAELRELTQTIDRLEEELVELDAKLVPYRRDKDLIRQMAIATHKCASGHAGPAVRQWVRADRSKMFAALDRLNEKWGPTNVKRRNTAADLSAARKAARRIYEIVTKRKALRTPQTSMDF